MDPRKQKENKSGDCKKQLQQQLTHLTDLQLEVWVIAVPVMTIGGGASGTVFVPPHSSCISYIRH